MKEEKFKQVLHYAQSLGLTPQELFNYMVAEKQANCLTEPVVVQQSKITHPCSGMFCYEDNSFSFELKELSMGMSSDYKIALQYGSTMIRIGRKLFT